jgi:signal transduction histidine kinase
MLANMRVLTVDDSATIRMFMRVLLARHGAAVAEASTGAEAIDAVTSGEHFDLILLDLILPDADGIDLLRSIRAIDQTTPIVMLTGMGGVKSATTAVHEGADGYLEKQDLAVGADHAQFFYALQQAIERRTGIVAQSQLQQFKTDFYSMITHDLRNPASAVQSALGLLLADKSEPLSAHQRELVDIAMQSAQQFNALINDYLDFAKIDAGYLRIQPEECELGALAESALRLAMFQCQTKRQTLTVSLPEDPVLAWVDGERFKQVIENLLSNAVKYTPEGGAIAVRLAASADAAVLEVADTGPGIPAEQMEDLFAKYHRGSGHGTRTVGGTGLGLFIVKEIVKAHGGIVTAVSATAPGAGTIFTVTLPLSLPAAPVAQSTEAR